MKTITRFEVAIVTYKYKSETNTAYTKLFEIEQSKKSKNKKPVFEKFSSENYEDGFFKAFNTKITVVKSEMLKLHHLAFFRHILKMNICVRKSMNKTFKTNQSDKVKIFTKVTESDRKFIERMVKHGFMEFCVFSINDKPFKDVLRLTTKGQELARFCGFKCNEAEGFYFDMI